MRQHPTPDPDPHEDEDLEALSTPVYDGSGLSIRALTAEDLQRFLDAHHGQPAQLLGGGWAALDRPGHPPGGPRTPSATAAVPAQPPTGTLGSPGRSALAAYRRRRAAALVAWRLRFRLSEQVRAWQRGAAGERRTARLLDRLTRDGFVVFHDLAVPGSPANVDHLVIGPTGVFVIDSKQWSGSVHQGADGLAWHNHYPLERALETVRWEAETVGCLLGTRAHPLLCVHGAYVHGGGLHAQAVAIVPVHLLRSALGYDRVLSDAEVELLAATARAQLRPAA
jgi:hypothetical protein